MIPFLKAVWELTLSTASATRQTLSKLSLLSLLTQFVENEMRSCSMDIGGITPKYVQRAWGGRVAIEDIAAGLAQIRAER